MMIWMSAIALAGPLLPGHAAPPLDGVEWIAVPEGAEAPSSWEDLAGKVVVIDFWATWCGPCVAAWPKVNKLAASAGDDVVVLALTSEPRAVVERFLRKSGGSPAWVGVEAKAVSDAWGISALPMYGVVGPDGQVHAVAADLPTREMLGHARDGTGRPETRGDDDLYGSQTFGPSDVKPRKRHYSVGPNSISAQGVDTGEILWLVSNLLPPTRVRHDAPVPASGRWKLDVISADGRSAEDIAMDLVGEAWGVTLGMARLELDALVLDGANATPGAPSDRFGCSAPTQVKGKTLTLRGCSPDQAAFALERLLGRPMVIEGMDRRGAWDWVLPWQAASPADAVLPALEALGFEAREEVRSLPGLVVGPRP